MLFSDELPKMRFQIRTLQVPRKGVGAFMPVFSNTPTAATNGQNEVIGMPGTVPVYSPRPAALNDGQLGGPYNQPSSCAPNYIMPSIYFARVNPSLQFNGKTWSDNVLPVPAKQPNGLIQQWQHRVRVGGRTTTTSNRPFTQWPTYNGRYN
jgi:hypothetical protein